LSRAAGVMALLVTVMPLVASGKVDPSTGLIRVICIGESYYPETSLPLILAADPRIRYQPVPANWYESTFAAVGRGRDDVLRFMRLYMPRTYEALLTSFDVILLSDFEVDVITNEQFVWMERSCREEGMGLGKYEMNYDPTYFSTFDLFVASAVYPAFPASLRRQIIPVPIEGIYAVNLPETGRPHPIVDLPGMSQYKVLTSGTYGYEDRREGATAIAKFKPRGEDAMIIWTYGKGRSLTCLPGHDKIDSAALKEWPYAVDFWINQMWYLAGLDIPEDIEVLHRIREESMKYIAERSLALSVIEFAEKFGASTRSLYEQLSEVDETKKRADRLYLEDRYSESVEEMKNAFDGLRRVSTNAIEMKDKALLWIYIVEWFSVTGTCMVAGFLLWSLMIKRRLYREVSVTRAG